METFKRVTQSRTIIWQRRTDFCARNSVVSDGF